MSEMEHHKGKLKRVDLTGYDNDINKFFEHLCKEVHPTWSDSDWEEEYDYYIKQGSDSPWITMWYDETDEYDKYIILKGSLWEVEDTELCEDEDMIYKVNEYEYEYYTAFYNGGTCLHECLEDLLKSRLSYE